MLTVAFWLWRGWRPVYTAEHVNTACRLLAAELTTPHRVVCITDMPEGVTECDTYPLWPDPPGLVTAGRPNCWRRIRLFDPATAAKIGPRILSMDIDMVPMASLDPLLATAEPFKIVRGSFAAYNGSMWVMDAGVHPHVWSKFKPATSPTFARRAPHPHRPGTRMVGSDQVWLSMQVPNAPTWGREDGILSYAAHAVGYKKAAAARLWFFAGGIKPWSAQTRKLLPAVHEKYMAHWKGRQKPIEHPTRN